MSETNDLNTSEQQNTEENDSTLTLNEVLQYEDQMIEDTAAVLGALNDKNCSYSEGYIKRQALYSCLTCIPEGKTDPDKRAGVCLACSYHCHDGHDLVELYTKRNFRCDCGNSKFAEIKCNLFASKSEVNENNGYNQNFHGTYCTCKRPYPDPEETVSDEMIQCILCEDWYHSRHLGAEAPKLFAEMICDSCVGSHEFLLNYDAFSITKAEKSSPNTSINVEQPDEPKSNNVENVQENGGGEKEPAKECTKPGLNPEATKCAKFWPDVFWRKQLCTCSTCMELYKNENVLFLLDPEDPVQCYEEKGKAKTKEIIEDQSKNMFNSMNRVQLVETIAGYNDLKTNLGEFLKTFAENKRVVKEEDIKEFFEGMQAKKKQKLDMPYYCR